jgi:hypothetical protein
MPVDACQFFNERAGCKALLRPELGDCCVFCFYGSVSVGPRLGISRKTMEQTEVAVRGGIRASILGVVINLGLSMTKCLAGIAGHSFALVARSGIQFSANSAPHIPREWARGLGTAPIFRHTSSEQFPLQAQLFLCVRKLADCRAAYHLAGTATLVA